MTVCSRAMSKPLTPSLIFAALLLGSSSPALADIASPEPEPETKTESKSDAKSDSKSKSGNCSVQTDNNQTVLGLAAFVLLISGAALRRRKAV